MRAVEDADVAGLRKALADPPQEVVLALLLRRGLEGGDEHALRVHLADDVPEGAALARRVHPLQDEQQAAVTVGPALGEEAFLQVGQPRAEERERLLPVRLRAVEARRGAGVDGGEVDRTGRKAEEVADADCAGPGLVGRLGGGLV